MQLLPGEKSLFSSKNNVLQLTNFRISMTVRTGNYTEVSSIYLDRLSSGKHVTKSGFDTCAGLLHQIEAAQAVAIGKIAEMPSSSTQVA